MIDPIIPFFSDDDDDSVRAREARAAEIGSLFPIPETGVAISGGLGTGMAFNEARLAYVYGLWISVVFTSMAAIERHIGASIYAAGGNEAKTMSLSELLDRACKDGLINDYETVQYGQLGKLRDDYMHFREPIEFVERLAESSKFGVGINEMMQDDARLAVALAAAYFQKNCSL